MVFPSQAILDVNPAFVPTAWLDGLRDVYDAPSLTTIAKALDLAEHTPEFAQVLGVASVLVALRLDYQTVAAALAAHVPQERPEQRAALEAQLGGEVAHLAGEIGRAHV